MATFTTMLKRSLLLLAFAAPVAFAGRPCEPLQPTVATVEKSFGLAMKARQALDDSGAQVALIARVGQDLSKYGLHYSHAGIVWRDHPEGRWTVVHELNQCGTAESDLYNEGLANFFLDNMFAYESLIVIPDAGLQQRLADALAAGHARQMHAAHYNMLSYPFSSKYQNSNQWVLETLAGAASADLHAQTREQAQAWLKLAGYSPSTVEIPALTRLGARMFKANVAFDDQPFDRRMAGKIDTVTVDSIESFLAQRRMESKKLALAYP